MDQGLFGKYQRFITTRENTYKEISLCIEEETGVILTEEELLLDKKKIKFHTSSVKKMILRNKNIEGVLTRKGYSVTW
jgi:hypothetical protein